MVVRVLQSLCCGAAFFVPDHVCSRVQDPDQLFDQDDHRRGHVTSGCAVLSHGEGTQGVLTLRFIGGRGGGSGCDGGGKKEGARAHKTQGGGRCCG